MGAENRRGGRSIGLAAVLAVLMLAITGIQYSVSIKASTLVGLGERVARIVGGLVLLLSAFILLNVVNPQLTKLESPGSSFKKQLGTAASTTSAFGGVQANKDKNIAAQKAIHEKIKEKASTTPGVLKDQGGDKAAGNICADKYKDDEKKITECIENIKSSNTQKGGNNNVAPSR